MSTHTKTGRIAHTHPALYAPYTPPAALADGWPNDAPTMSEWADADYSGIEARLLAGYDPQAEHINPYRIRARRKPRLPGPNRSQWARMQSSAWPYNGTRQAYLLFKREQLEQYGNAMFDTDYILSGRDGTYSTGPTP